MKTLAALIITIGASSALAQNPNDDPSGWTKAKWGMTEQDLRKVFPEAEPLQKDVFQHLDIQHFRIDGESIGAKLAELFKVTFVLDKEAKLTSVHLATEGKLVKSDGTDFGGPPLSVAQFTEIFLLQKLTDNYGKPTQTSSEEDSGTQAQKWVWIFPTTQISLVCITDPTRPNSDLNRTDLSYQQRKKDSAL